jgi:hypothetical protein
MKTNYRVEPQRRSNIQAEMQPRAVRATNDTRSAPWSSKKVMVASSTGRPETSPKQAHSWLTLTKQLGQPLIGTDSYNLVPVI